jgi:hypothetical protein
MYWWTKDLPTPISCSAFLVDVSFGAVAHNTRIADDYGFYALCE